jgi:hypothetical protein
MSLVEESTIAPFEFARHQDQPALNYPICLENRNCLVMCQKSGWLDRSPDVHFLELIVQSFGVGSAPPLAVARL